jgi:hypothetical protein
MFHRRFRILTGYVASGAVALGFGGCLASGGRVLRQSVPTLLTSVATEFLIDNDAVLDVFQDDFGTGTVFDDRFVPGSSRTEPDGAVNGTFNTGG